MMNERNKSSEAIGSNIESKEGERGLLFRNKANERSPSLEYEYIPDDEKLNSAFDVLFEEVIRSNNEENLWNKPN